MQKIILITGISSGIGKACAEFLTKKGFKVYGTLRIPTDTPLPYEVVIMDVTNKLSIQEAIHTILAKESRIDILINNAGMGISGAIEDCSEDEIKLQFDTNFFGIVNLCKAILPPMRKQKNGLIINISSIGGLMGLPFQGYYSASKFAINGFSEALRNELSNTGVTVVTINPSDFKTAFTKNRKIAGNALTGDYADRFKKTLDTIESDESKGSDPIVIAKKIAKIISKKSPQMHYLVGRMDQVLFAKAKGFLPSKLFLGILGSHYKV